MYVSTFWHVAEMDRLHVLQWLRNSFWRNRIALSFFVCLFCFCFSFAIFLKPKWCLHNWFSHIFRMTEFKTQIPRHLRNLIYEQDDVSNSAHNVFKINGPRQLDYPDTHKKRGRWIRAIQDRLLINWYFIIKMSTTIAILSLISWPWKSLSQVCSPHVFINEISEESGQFVSMLLRVTCRQNELLNV